MGTAIIYEKQIEDTDTILVVYKDFFDWKYQAEIRHVDGKLIKRSVLHSTRAGALAEVGVSFDSEGSVTDD